MKLERVELFDVRQFAGRQAVDFAVGARKITLVHGPNTCGKTTLLNAIYWCFYGDFLPGFSEPGRLRSEQAAGETFGAEVTFEHRGKRYVAKRSGNARPDQAKLEVLEQKLAGQSVPHPQPELLIASILAKPLAPFFFFAGEMILKGLSTGTYQQGATEAIRSVLGLKLAELAIEDLKDLRKRKQRELQTLSAGTNLATVSADLAEAEQYVESRLEQLGPQRSLATQLEKQKREIYDELRGQESSSALQQRREKIETQLGQAKQRLRQAEAERQSLIFDVGHSSFLSQVAQDVPQFINDGITRKKVPSPFDKTFVKDILDAGTCICERPIAAGSPEYRAIAAMINSATDEVMIRRTLAVRATSERIATLAATSERALRSVLQRLEDGQNQLEQTEQEYARVRELMQRHEATNVREKEAQLERIEETLRDLAVNRRRTEDDIENKKNDIARLRTELDRAQAASPQVAQAKTGLELVELLITSLQKELEAVEARGLMRITDTLNSVVANSTRQKYSAEVTNEYAIKLFRTADDGTKLVVHVLSDGEQRLLDLCFVSALVAVCRERETETDAILLPGAVAPLIVDAPFGQLDPEYQALAVKTMMDLSDQLVLLLSKTHWTKEVDSAIRPSIGKEYLLIGHRRGSAGGAAPVQINVDGRVYDQMIYDSTQDWTEVKPIGRPL